MDRLAMLVDKHAPHNKNIVRRNCNPFGNDLSKAIYTKSRLKNNQNIYHAEEIKYDVSPQRKTTIKKTL